MSIKRVAIIGAGGFLGINLAQYLVHQVDELRCFGRSCTFPSALQGIHWVNGNLADARMKEVISGCDAVVHLASTSTPATADQNIAVDAEQNLLSTLSLLDCCVSCDVKRVVFISSGGTVYGIPAQVPTPENTPTEPITSYGVIKLAIEKYLEIYRRQKGLDYRILRLSNAYGPYQTASKGQGVVAAFLMRSIENQPIHIMGDGQVVRDYVYVEDIVEAIWMALNHQGEYRLFNIGSGHGMSLLSIADAIEVLLDKPIEKIFHPGRLVDVPVSILDARRASVDMGWHPKTTFFVGLKKTAAWLQFGGG